MGHLSVSRQEYSHFLSFYDLIERKVELFNLAAVLCSLFEITPPPPHLSYNLPDLLARPLRLITDFVSVTWWHRAIFNNTAAAVVGAGLGGGASVAQ